jgi:hypothetical protein
LYTSPTDTADTFAKQIDSVVNGTLDIHCPLGLQTRTNLSPSSSKRDNRWLSAEAVTAKRQRRQLERKWKSRGREEDRVAYRAACRNANRVITASLRQACAAQIRSAEFDTHRRWSTIRDALHTTQSVETRSSGENYKLCSSSLKYFKDKIRTIKGGIASISIGSNTNALYVDERFMPLFRS